MWKNSLKIIVFPEEVSKFHPLGWSAAACWSLEQDVDVTAETSKETKFHALRCWSTYDGKWQYLDETLSEATRLGRTLADYDLLPNTKREHLLLSFVAGEYENAAQGRQTNMCHSG